MTRTQSDAARVTVIGAGLAGCEAANILSSMGVKVRLCEMKPMKMTPAHHSEDFAELVCSNSLRAASTENAIGLLKEELRRLGSLIMEAADKAQVPAGGALAVDRNEFSSYITSKIRNNPNIEIVDGEVLKIPDDGIVIIATGPLTAGDLYDDIVRITGDSGMHFFDAAAPIVSYDSIDMTKAFKASRYGKGGDDYINCPMTKEEYINFRNELVTAERAEVKDFDKEIVFEGCMPIETMASRGEDTMRYGPLKPVGLVDPKTGREPYACLQLRQDDRESTMYNLVGFQTRLKWPEQKRVFGMIPGLENAEYVRYGVMHRNSYLNSPKCLTSHYSLRERPNVFFAGQITGVEGYIESTASGFLAGYYAGLMALEIEPEFEPSADTAIGSMALYVSDPSIKHFQPMNANHGIMSPIAGRFKGKTGKKDRNRAIADRALEEIGLMRKTLDSVCRGDNV
ncbi:MAG: methylenetetrahydrofolate--tRNA-(uracil(54)-C(5))-methyltransferase (FADH(2)-oxidizing) TrmFO [Ruminococcaceae bacterium]|nr:methylenetetrahydrofolate--tRNA-(uracil(54)-C(5))-methyltransferase (FADH(2)-oxidizing) TrmFO [Oscillospiraceae bacterium]